MKIDEITPAVSVIVLTYNHEKYIEQALNSILEQKTNFKYEILVGDDGSTDNTVKILKKYKMMYPGYFRLFLNTKNLGATKNAYNLLKRAKGDYLAVCEGDDYWVDVQKLQIQFDYLNKNEMLVGCTHDFSVVDEFGRKIDSVDLIWVKKKKKFTINDFQGLFLPGQPATFFRRNLIKQKKINLQWLYRLHYNLGDRTMMFLFLLCGDFGYIEREMSCYRKKTKNSITNSLKKNRLNQWKNDYLLIKKYEQIANSYACNVSFTEGKKILFAKMILWGIYKLNTEYFKSALKILIQEKQPIHYCFYVPFYCFKRLSMKLKEKL